MHQDFKMSVRDHIKEIMQEYEEEIAKLKKDRERVISLYKEALRVKKIKELKDNLNSNESRK